MFLGDLGAHLASGKATPPPGRAVGWEIWEKRGRRKEKEKGLVWKGKRGEREKQHEKQKFPSFLGGKETNIKE